MIPTKNLVAALANGGVEWWTNPKTRRQLLRTKHGVLYRTKWAQRGWILTRTENGY